MRVKTLLMLTSILLVAVFAFGQSRIISKATIPFAFSVQGSVLPAGEYDFSEDGNATTITVRATARGGASAFTPVITRLAAGIHTTPKDAHIVFDRVGESYTLAEIWLPGEDGFVLHATKGKHEHRIMDVPK